MQRQAGLSVTGHLLKWAYEGPEGPDYSPLEVQQYSRDVANG